MDGVKKEQMLARVSTVVLIYGIFVGISLIANCLVPLLELMVAFEYIEETAWISRLNQNFSIPLETIVFMYTLMVPLYLGIDRATSFLFITKQGANEITIGNPKKLFHVMIQTLIIYILGVGLSLIFTHDFQLTQLATTLGLSVLLFVAGRKSNTLAEAIHKDKPDDKLKDLIVRWQLRRKYLADGGAIVDNNRDGIDDELLNTEQEIIEHKQQIGELKL